VKESTMYYHTDLLKLMIDFVALPDADERYRRV
jgi:hypothetical protein